MDYAVRPIWNVIATLKGTVEPERWIGPIVTGWSSGRGVGFYVYASAPHDAVIETMEITIP